MKLTILLLVLVMTVVFVGGPVSIFADPQNMTLERYIEQKVEERAEADIETDLEAEETDNWILKYESLEDELEAKDTTIFILSVIIVAAGLLGINGVQ